MSADFLWNLIQLLLDELSDRLRERSQDKSLSRWEEKLPEQEVLKAIQIFRDDVRRWLP